MKLTGWFYVFALVAVLNLLAFMLQLTAFLSEGGIAHLALVLVNAGFTVWGAVMAKKELDEFKR